MQYFASALTLSSMSLLSNLQLVTKVYFPRTLLPLARRGRAATSTSSIGLPVLLVLMWYYDTWPGGVEVRARAALHRARGRDRTRGGLLLSAVNVRFRDVRYMIPVFLQVLPLLSGVHVRRLRRSRRSGSGSSPSTR